MITLSKGVDSAGHPSGESLVAAGQQVVAVYLGGSFATTKAILEDYMSHGRWCVALWEVAANAALRGAAGGTADMHDAMQAAKSLGIPAEAILILCDDDSSAPQNLVLSYWEAGLANAHANGFKAGGYGPHAICTAGLKAGSVDAVMVAGGWEDGLPETGVAIKQGVAQMSVGGVTCDIDQILLPETAGLLWNLNGLYVDLAPTTVPPSNPTPTPVGDNVTTEQLHLTVSAGQHQATLKTTLPSSKLEAVTLVAGAGPNIVSEVAWSDVAGVAEIVVKMESAPTADLIVTVEVLLAS